MDDVWGQGLSSDFANKVQAIVSHMVWGHLLHYKSEKGYVIDKWEHFRCKRNKQEMIAVFVSILKASKSHVAPLEIVGNYMAVNQMC